jgi:PIN domain nuclease of toxin-antitoxin system
VPAVIDTCVLIWASLNPGRLSKRAVAALANNGNYFSHVSLLELAIKCATGQIKLQLDGKRASAGKFILNAAQHLRLEQLPLDFNDIQVIETLPYHHKDPFDRLLVCQCRVRGLPVISPDKQLDAYEIMRIW